MFLPCSFDYSNHLTKLVAHSAQAQNSSVKLFTCHARSSVPRMQAKGERQKEAAKTGAEQSAG